MDEKQFVKAITRMFNKKGVISVVGDIVMDGFILYKGDLSKDVFYRLRLEANQQTEMDVNTPQTLFDKSVDFINVDLFLKYTLDQVGNGVDVWTVGEDPSAHSPYIAFDKKFRQLFQNGWAIKLDYKDENLLSGMAHLKTEFGEIMVMPFKLDEERILR
jgi:hypothetical protein